MNNNASTKKTISIVSFAFFLVISIIHIVFTNLDGNLFAYTKVLLMPTLALFFFLTVKNKKRGLPIIWAQAGLWIGNICLIWGEKSNVLFALGSAATIIGFLGYLYIMGRDVKKLSVWYIVLQIPIIWISAFFIFLMKDDLGTMLVPMALYIMMIALISLTALAQLISRPKSLGCWLMFAASLFYIAENGLYTADHYMSSLSFGVHIVHPCFITAQTLFAVGYLLIESKKSLNGSLK